LLYDILRIACLSRVKLTFLENPNFVYAVLRNKKRFEGMTALDENVSTG